jgi:hypothetical protein
MMRIYRSLFVCALFLCGTLAFAQATPDQVCEVNVTTPKPGAAKMFEEARKQHNKFHVAEKDKDAINVWSLTTGPATGSYLTTTCGLTWKGLDGREGFDQRDEADRQKTITPAGASNQASYYVYRPDLSNPGPSAEMAKPPKMITIVHYYVKPASVQQFQDAIKRISAAIKKTNYPVKPSRWYSLVSGGEGPHYVLVTDRNSWSDMELPQTSMADMLKQAGDEKALQDLRDAFRYTMSEMAEYRADLSYVPAK